MSGTTEPRGSLAGSSRRCSRSTGASSRVILQFHWIDGLDPLQFVVRPAAYSLTEIVCSPSHAKPPELTLPDFVTFVLDSADFRGFRHESPMNPGRPGWPGAV